MVTETFEHQRQADDQQERQGQHLDRRMRGHEFADVAGKEHHQAHRGDDRGDHDRDFIHHADGGNDRVEREHQIDDDDLEDDGGKGSLDGLHFLAFFTLEQLVNFLSALPQKEDTATEQNQITGRNRLAKNRGQRLGRTDNPGEHQQQSDAHEHGKKQSDLAGFLALMFRQPVDKDGDENDVVDTEHQFQAGEGQESDK